MRGQASIELVMVVGITLVICFMLLVRFTNQQGGVLVDGIARQEMLHQMDLSGNAYTLEKVESVACGTAVKVNVTVQPAPTGTDATSMAANIAAKVTAGSGMALDRSNVTFDKPEALTCQVN